MDGSLDLESNPLFVVWLAAYGSAVSSTDPSACSSPDAALLAFRLAFVDSNGSEIPCRT